MHPAPGREAGLFDPQALGLPQRAQHGRRIDERDEPLLSQHDEVGLVECMEGVQGHQHPVGAVLHDIGQEFLGEANAGRSKSAILLRLLLQHGADPPPGAYHGHLPEGAATPLRLDLGQLTGDAGSARISER